MQTIQIKISDFEIQKYNIRSGEIKFSDLVEKISLEYAKNALLECNLIAEETGLSKISLEELNNEIEAVRNAKNNS